MFNEHQIAILEKYSISAWPGSSSPDHYSGLIKLSGARAAEDKGHPYVSALQQYTKTFFKEEEENLPLSFMFASFLPFAAFQIKGSYRIPRACSPEKVSYQKALVEGCCQTISKLVVKAAPAFAGFYKAPGIIIRMKAAEVYEQKPGQELNSTRK